MVIVENPSSALVLDGDHREPHDLGDLLAADDGAVLLAV
jgi:hypothetical protein